MKTLPNDIFFAEVEHILSEGGSVMLTVQGNSMRPFICSGRTRVVLSPCDAEELHRGDVVLFRYRGRHILHRIIEVDNGRLLLAGDGNYRQFEQCDRDDVAARVVAVVCSGGREISCTSRLWRWASGFWMWLHPFVRRCILAILWRTGIR